MSGTIARFNCSKQSSGMIPEMSFYSLKSQTYPPPVYFIPEMGIPDKREK
jgi:hypothetical protein